MKPKENLSKATGTRNPNRLKGLPKLENIESHFNRNFLEIRTLSNILDNLNPEAKEEIRRAQLVFLMSALDSYMHEIVAYGYIMMFYGYWRQTEAYRRQNVLLSDLESVADKTADRESFKSCHRHQRCRYKGNQIRHTHEI